MPVALLAAGSIAPADAAHPLLTEDTGTQGLGNAQLELMVDSIRDRPPGVTVREQVTTAVFSYGVRDDVDLQLGLPHVRQHTHDAAGRRASEGALEAEARKLEDRFGEASRGARLLLDVQRLRIRLSAMRIRAVGREENRPVFRIDAGFSPERLAGSPVPVRRLDASAYMLEEDAPDDMAAFRVFLEWSGALAA